MKILIADESELIRTVTGKIIRHDMPDAEIVEADSTIAALARLREQLPDAAIIDISGRQINAFVIAENLQFLGARAGAVYISQFAEDEAVKLQKIYSGAFLYKGELDKIPALIRK